MHPLEPDLTKLSDDDLHKKHGELQKRYIQASRMGSGDAVWQLQILLDSYRYEISERNRRQMEKLQEKMQNSGKDFDGIINIE